MASVGKIDFEKLNKNFLARDLYSYFLNDKIELCQEVSNLNFSNPKLVPKDKILNYQKCIEQTIRIDYSIGKQRSQFERDMSKKIEENSFSKNLK